MPKVTVQSVMKRVSTVVPVLTISMDQIVAVRAVLHVLPAKQVLGTVLHVPLARAIAVAHRGYTMMLVAAISAPLIVLLARAPAPVLVRLVR